MVIHINPITSPRNILLRFKEIYHKFTLDVRISNSFALLLTRELIWSLNFMKVYVKVNQHNRLKRRAWVEKVQSLIHISSNGCCQGSTAHTASVQVSHIRCTGVLTRHRSDLPLGFWMPAFSRIWSLIRQALAQILPICNPRNRSISSGRSHGSIHDSWLVRGRGGSTFSFR